VVNFAAEADYSAYRILPGADGFSLTGSRGEYIVVHGTRGDLRLAAHEYTHLLIHSSGFTLPDWLAEGQSVALAPTAASSTGPASSPIGKDAPGKDRL